MIAYWIEIEQKSHRLQFANNSTKLLFHYAQGKLSPDSEDNTGEKTEERMSQAPSSREGACDIRAV